MAALLLAAGVATTGVGVVVTAGAGADELDPSKPKKLLPIEAIPPEDGSL